MRRRAFLGFVLALLACAALARTPASFRGTVVEPAATGVDDLKQGRQLIYVMSRNGALRKVEVSKARIIFSDDVPPNTRPATASEALKRGAEVRVLAEENGNGLWKARDIEILSLPGAQSAEPQPKRKAEPEADSPPGPVLTKRGL